MPATIVLYENDRNPINYETAVAIASVLNIDRTRLFNEYTAFIDYPCSSLLKNARTELGLNQMRFSEEIGVAQSAYSRWERGAGKPRRQEYDKIAAAMNRHGMDIHSLVAAGAR